MIIDVLILPYHTGYIAGTADGIVTVNGVPSRRDIAVFSADNLAVVQKTTSLNNGCYLITNLDPSKRYLVMCRDLSPDGIHQRYEPAVWDYVIPSTDLTLDEQQALWQSWQS